MSKRTRKSCRKCEQLERRIEAQAVQISSLQSEIAKLQEKLAAAQKDSSTSSKPPSSDIVKPPPTTSSTDGERRKIGGQPGHAKHEREPFPPEQVTDFKVHRLDQCPCCGGVLRLNAPFTRIVQQVDILQPVLSIEQHTCPEYWCDHCRQPYWAPLPSVIANGGLAGPGLTALIAYMKGVCHASFSTVRKFLRDVVQVTISRGELSKILNKVTAALEQPYEELLQTLPGEPHLNVDETGHKNNKERWWTWCLRADLYTVYHLDAHRSAEVLMDLLGREFAGVLGCDYFSAYRRFMRECSVQVQFCLAHLIRDVKFLTTLPDARDQQYGEGLRQSLKRLFAVFHERAGVPPVEFQRRLQHARDQVLRAGLNDVPCTQHSQNMANRFRKHGEAYFTFITTPGIGPTNNAAEQAIRFVVIDRHITQGTRSEHGRKWSERIWTVIATCVQQGKSVYEYLCAVTKKWFANERVPSLLSAGVET